MNDNLTHIAVVLDESGSMTVVREATVEGFNAFMAEQAKQPGAATVDLVKFSDAVRIPTFINKPLSETPKLDYTNYMPMGGTALFDAIGTTIQSLGERLRNTPEAERPGKVIVMIQTDGEENSSRMYNLEQIKSMIEHQQSKYNWGFMFIGANIDAFAAGGMLGILPSATLQYDTKGSRNAFKSVSNYMTSARTLGIANAAYTAQDRTQAVTPDAK